MAILADTGEFPSALIDVLAKQDLQLILVSSDETKKLKLKEDFEHLNATAEIDFISCEKEGCWEADLIVLSQNDRPSAPLLQKIKEVATQKIVLVVSENNQDAARQDLAKLLPNSKIVEIKIRNKNVYLSSDSMEAKKETEKLFNASDYKIK